MSTLTLLPQSADAALTRARMALAIRPPLPITIPISSGATLNVRLIELSVSS